MIGPIVAEAAKLAGRQPEPALVAGIAGLTQAWRDEECSARNYRALAKREPNPERKAILIRLAEAEDKHATNWATRLQ